MLACGHEQMVSSLLRYTYIYLLSKCVSLARKPMVGGTSNPATPAVQSQRLQEYIRRGIIARDSLSQDIQGGNGIKRLAIHPAYQGKGALGSNTLENSKRARIVHELQGTRDGGDGLGSVASHAKPKDDSCKTCN